MCIQYINMHAVSNTFIINTIYISVGAIITITMHLSQPNEPRQIVAQLELRFLPSKRQLFSCHCLFCATFMMVYTKTPPYMKHTYLVHTLKHTQTNLPCCRLSMLLVHETVPAV